MAAVGVFPEGPERTAASGLSKPTRSRPDRPMRRHPRSRIRIIRTSVDNLARLDLPVDRILPLHGRVVALTELYVAVGQSPPK